MAPTIKCFGRKSTHIIELLVGIGSRKSPAFQERVLRRRCSTCWRIDPE